jgi:hypothetical protein
MQLTAALYRNSTAYFSLSRQSVLYARYVFRGFSTRTFEHLVTDTVSGRLSVFLFFRSSIFRVGARACEDHSMGAVEY